MKLRRLMKASTNFNKSTAFILPVLLSSQVGGCAEATDFMRIVHDSFGPLSGLILLAGVFVLILFVHFLFMLVREMMNDVMTKSKIRGTLRTDPEDLTIDRIERLSRLPSLLKDEFIRYYLVKIGRKDVRRLLELFHGSYPSHPTWWSQLCLKAILDIEVPVVNYLAQTGRKDVNRLLGSFDVVRPPSWLRLCFRALKKIEGPQANDLLKQRLTTSPSYKLAEVRLRNMKGMLIDDTFIVESAKGDSSKAYKLAALEKIARMPGAEDTLIVFTDEEKYNKKVVTHATELLRRKLGAEGLAEELKKRKERKGNPARTKSSVDDASSRATPVGLSANGGQSYGASAREPCKYSEPAPSEIGTLFGKMKELVKDLECSDKVAQDFVQMVIGWKDGRGRASVVACKNKLVEARESHKQMKTSREQLTTSEEIVVRGMCWTIQKELPYDRRIVELSDVVRRRQAQCVSYSQLVYILGESIGLSVKPIRVLELVTPGPLPEGQAHMSCLVSLTDGSTMMVDLTPEGFVSKPFTFRNEFERIGNYWGLRNKSNPLCVDRTIQVSGRRGLIAGLCNWRGNSYANLSQYTRALSCFTRAIELEPNDALSYFNRGNTYMEAEEYAKAISDYGRALELCPNIAHQTYTNRGQAYDALGLYTRAISDYTRAIKLYPKNAKSYFNRAIVYAKLESTQAFSDLIHAVMLDPKYASVLQKMHDRVVKIDPKGAYLLQKACDYALRLDPKSQVHNLERLLDLFISGSDSEIGYKDG
jgi:tetratricopeptide (TPR) repeat protein